MLSSISQGHSEVRMHLLMRSKSTGSSAWEEAIRYVFSGGKISLFFKLDEGDFFPGSFRD